MLRGSRSPSPPPPTGSLSLSGLPLQTPERSIMSFTQRASPSIRSRSISPKLSKTSTKTAAMTPPIVSTSSTTTRPTDFANSEMIWKHGEAKEVQSEIVPISSSQFTPPPDLKERVEKAIKEHKVFMTNVRYPGVRIALENRGWIQKHANVGTIPMTFMSPIGEERQYQAKRDKAVRSWIEEALMSHPADLIWRFGYDKFDWKEVLPNQLVNYHPSCHLDPKLQLVERIHELQWYSQQDVAYTYFPRCYLLSVPEERNAFVGDYCLTACVGLLQWFVGTYEEFGPGGVTVKRNGLTPVCFNFALSQIRNYITVRSHQDIDLPVSPPMFLNDSWKIFLNQWFDIVYGSKRLQVADGRPGTIKELYETCKLALKAIAPYWPQMYIDGTFNVWICKPGRGIQGSGILIMNDVKRILELLPAPGRVDKNWIIQKYIERPLLVYNTKCDFRQWFMVTDWRPLKVWFYKEAYFRFSSQPFRINRLGNSVHVLNTQVQGKYEVSDSRDPRLPEDSMWDTTEFVQYLRRKGKAETWRTKTLPEVKRSILSVLFACQDKVGPEYRKNSFQVYGADFMISGDMTPWLLEINSVPYFGTTRRVTKRLVPQFLEDVIKVVVDRRNNLHAGIGSFELIHRGMYVPTDYMPAETPMIIISGKKITSTASNLLRSSLSDSTVASVELTRMKSSVRTLTGAEEVVQDITKRITLKELAGKSFTTLESNEPKKGEESESEWEYALFHLADRFRVLESRLSPKLVDEASSKLKVASTETETLSRRASRTSRSRTLSAVGTPIVSNSALVSARVSKKFSGLVASSASQKESKSVGIQPDEIIKVVPVVPRRGGRTSPLKFLTTAEIALNAVQAVKTASASISHSQQYALSTSSSRIPALVATEQKTTVVNNKWNQVSEKSFGQPPAFAVKSKSKAKASLSRKEPAQQPKVKSRPSLANALSRLRIINRAKPKPPNGT